MHKIIYLAILMLLVLLQSISVGAILVEISKVNGTYYPGDYVKLETKIFNGLEENKTYILEEIVFEAESTPNIFPVVTLLELGPMEGISVTQSSFFITADMSPGDYIYSVRILEEGKDIKTAGTSFKINGTMKRFKDISILLCNDLTCSLDELTFTRSERIFLRVTGKEDAMLQAEIIYPDKMKKTLLFSNGTAEIPSKQIGKYRAIIIASKEGYEDYMTELEFHVIEKDVMVGDLFASESSIPGYSFHYLLFLIPAVIIIIIAIRRRRKHKSSDEEEWEKLDRKFGA